MGCNSKNSNNLKTNTRMLYSETQLKRTTGDQRKMSFLEGFLNLSFLTGFFIFSAKYFDYSWNKVK